MSNISPRKRQVIDALIIIIPAILLGPPIGGLLLGVGSGIYVLVNIGLGSGGLGSGGLAESGAGETLLQIALLPLLYAVFSYLIAGIPAAIAAVGIALQSWWTGRISFLQVAGWITVCVFGYAAILFSGPDWEAGPKELGFGAIFLICGLIAGWFLFKWFTPLLSHRRKIRKTGNGGWE